MARIPASFKAQTSEIHLLCHPSTILYADVFQLKIETQSGLDITSSQDTVYTVLSQSSTIITVSSTGLITSNTIGEDYIIVTYKHETLLIKVRVHLDLKIVSGKYAIYPGDPRLTLYSSVINTSNPDDNEYFYYIPTIFAEFVDSGGNSSFGDISTHPFLKYDEKKLDTTNITSGTGLLYIEKISVPFTSTLISSGRFRANVKGMDATGNNDKMQPHRKLMVTIHGDATNTAIYIDVRCEDTIYQRNAKRLKLLNAGNHITSRPVTRILMLAEGFTEQDESKFTSACQSFMNEFKNTLPYKLLVDTIEFWAVFDYSAQSGVTISTYVNETANKFTMIPLGLNYFDKFTTILKACITQNGLYDGTNASQTDAEDFFDNNYNTHGLLLADKGNFIDKYTLTQISGLLQNKDTRFNVLLGGDRLADKISSTDDITSGNDFWLKNTDYFDSCFDTRKGIYERENPSTKTSFLNAYLSSLTDNAGAFTGNLWKTNFNNLNDNNLSNLDRNFLAIIINHPLSLGVNIRQQYFSTTIGTAKTINLSKVLSTNFIYGDNSNNGFPPANWSLDLTKCATFIHEFTHFINIKDEYEDERGESKKELSPSHPEYKGVLTSPNIDSFDNIKFTNGSGNKIDPLKVKWNFNRIDQALLCETQDNLTTPSHTNELEITFTKTPDWSTRIQKWQNIKDNEVPVFIRSLHFSPNADKTKQNFITIGEYDSGPIKIKSIDNTNSKIVVEFAGTVLLRISHLLGQIGKQFCLYTIKKDLSTIKSITIPLNGGGSGFKKKGKKLTLEVTDTDGYVKKGKGVKVELSISEQGVANAISIVKNAKTPYFTNDSTTLKILLKKSLFEDTHTEPQFNIELEPFFSSIKNIYITDPGSGYEDSAIPQVTITPSNGASYEAVLTGDKAFATIDTSNTGGEFIDPVYIKVEDNRGVPSHKKIESVKSLIVELDSSKRIKEYYLTSLGTTPLDKSTTNNGFSAKLFSNEKEIALDTSPALEFQAQLYIKRVQENISGYIQNNIVTEHQIINYSTSPQHTPIDIPRCPLGFYLRPKNPQADTIELYKKKATILCYLNQSGEVNKIEILNQGLQFAVDEEYDCSEVITEYEYNPTPDLVSSLYYRENFNTKNAYFQKRKRIYPKTPQDQFTTEREIRNIQPSFYGRDNSVEWPILRILKVSTTGQIEEIGFKKTGQVEAKGSNLRYPISGIMIFACGPSYFNECTPVLEDIINSHKLSLKGIELPYKFQFNANIKFRIIGGKYDVTAPSGSSSFTDSYSVMYDDTANSGGAQIILRQGRSILEIRPKRDLNNNPLIGSNFTTDPVVDIDAPTIGLGTQAHAVARIASNATLMNNDIIDIMRKNTEALILSLHKNDKDNIRGLDHTNAYFAPFITEFNISPASAIETDPIFDSGTSENDDAVLSLIRKKIIAFNSSKAIGDLILDENSVRLNNLIAIFEGGGTFDFNAFRPSYNSLMRDHYKFITHTKANNSDPLQENDLTLTRDGNIEFNLVTMYYVVNFLNPAKLSELDREIIKSLKYIIKNKKYGTK